MSKKATYGVQCENLYVRDGRNVSEISRILPVTIPTISKWKIAGEWDRKRDVFMRSSVIASEMLLSEAVALLKNREASDEPMPAKEADAIVKIISAAKRLEEKTDFPETALVVLGELLQFLKERDREAAKALDRNVTDFSEYVWGKYRGPGVRT